jgi:hypothetical protein
MRLILKERGKHRGSLHMTSQPQTAVFRLGNVTRETRNRYLVSNNYPGKDNYWQ